MSNHFTLRLIPYFRAKKKDQGFNIIELLIVVNIISMFAAVALPNLLGQVGRSREAEAKNGIGAMNRAQQFYHLEKRRFAGNLNSVEDREPEFDLRVTSNVLGLVLNSRYYDFAFQTLDPTAAGSPLPPSGQYVGNYAIPIDGANQGLRGFGSVVAYTDGQYANIVCASREITTGLSVYYYLSGINQPSWCSSL